MTDGATGALARHVVVGLKRSQRAVVDEAAGEAVRRGVALRVVHSVWLPLYETSTDKGARLRAAGQDVLDAAHRLVAESPTQVHTEFVLSLRPPVVTLLDEARSATCLVVGTTELRWFDRLRGNEVTTRVARQARCPVLVVPDAVDGPRRGVVVGVDVEPLSHAVLARAVEEAELRGCGLRLLHAVRPGHTARAARRAHDVVDRAADGVRTSHPRLEVATTVATAGVGTACVEASKAAELLVLGRPRQTPVERVLAGHVSMGVLRSARCPVLITTGTASMA